MPIIRGGDLLSLITKLLTRHTWSTRSRCGETRVKRTININHVHGSVDLISVKWDEPVKQQVCANLICGQFLVEFYIAVMPDEPVQWIILSYNIYIHHLYGIRLTLTYNVFIVTSTTSQAHDTKFWQRDTWHLGERSIHRMRHNKEGKLIYRA